MEASVRQRTHIDTLGVTLTQDRKGWSIQLSPEFTLPELGALMAGLNDEGFPVAAHSGDDGLYSLKPRGKANCPSELLLRMILTKRPLRFAPLMEVRDTVVE